MPGTKGLNTQKATVKLGATGTAVSGITAITKALPARATKTAHGLTDGQVVVISGATGMTQINGRVAVVANSDADNFDLAGIDSTAFSVYTSGATATPTQIKLNGMKSISGLDGQATELDDTDMDSDGKEYQGGLADYGQFSIEKKTLRISDTGEQVIQAALDAGVPVPTEYKRANGSGYNFNWLVKGYADKGGVDQLAMGTVQGRISGRPVKF